MNETFRVIVTFLFFSISIAPASSFARSGSSQYETLPEQKTPLAKKKNIQIAAVLGKDTRGKLPDNLRKFKLNIGLLSTDAGTRCTAFCISEKLAVTAAHCIFGSKKAKKADPTFITFRLDAGRVKHSTIPGRNTKETLAHIVAGQKKAINYPRDAKRDWAIFRLSKPICFGGLPLYNPTTNQIAQATREKRLFMIGYHGDHSIRDGLLFSNECQLRNRNTKKFVTPQQRRHYAPASRFLLHTCDTFNGSSGSPVFIETKEGSKIVAINIGHFSTRRYKKRGKKIKWTGKIRTTNVALRTSTFIDIANRLKSETLLISKDKIKQLQTLLNTSGLKAGTADGILGRGTKNAIRAFETKHQIPATGVPTQQLLNRLQKLIAQRN